MPSLHATSVQPWVMPYINCIRKQSKVLVGNVDHEYSHAIQGTPDLTRRWSERLGLVTVNRRRVRDQREQTGFWHATPVAGSGSTSTGHAPHYAQPGDLMTRRARYACRQLCRPHPVRLADSRMMWLIFTLYCYGLSDEHAGRYSGCCARKNLITGFDGLYAHVSNIV